MFSGAGFEEVFVFFDGLEDAAVGEAEGGVDVGLEFFIGGHVEGGGEEGVDVEAGVVGGGDEPFVFTDETHGGGDGVEMLSEGGEELLLVGGELGVGFEKFLVHALGAGFIFEGDVGEDAVDVLFEFVGVELEGGFEVEFFGWGGGIPGSDEMLGAGFDAEPAEFGIDEGAPGGLPFFDPRGFAEEFEHGAPMKN